MIIVVLGGTCSGKTKFAEKCEKIGFEKVITNTTRSRREDDLENSYHFLTKAEFNRKIENGEMLEYAEYNGNLYGTSVDSITKNCIIVLEPNGFRSLKRIFKDKVYSIFLKVSDEERYKRGLSRNDNIAILKERILNDKYIFDENLEKEVDLVLTDTSYCNMDGIIKEKLLSKLN